MVSKFGIFWFHFGIFEFRVFRYISLALGIVFSGTGVRKLAASCFLMEPIVRQNIFCQPGRIRKEASGLKWSDLLRICINYFTNCVMICGRVNLWACQWLPFLRSERNITIAASFFFYSIFLYINAITPGLASAPFRVAHSLGSNSGEEVYVLSSHPSDADLIDTEHSV